FGSRDQCGTTIETIVTHAELAVHVVSPGIQAAIGGQGVAAVRPSGDRNEIDVRQVEYEEGEVAVGVRPVAELTEATVSPRIDIAVLDRQAVVGSRCDGGDAAGQADDVHGN